MSDIPNSDPLPRPLEELREKLQRWRADPDRAKRIPEEIWSLAVELTREFGVYRTARTGSLDFSVLKKRAAAAGLASAPKKRRPNRGRAKPRKKSSFVEVRPAAATSSSCVVEIEDRAGAKMRFHLASTDAQTLATLARDFLRHEG